MAKHEIIVQWIKDVVVDPPDGCVEWPFSRRPRGYGQAFGKLATHAVLRADGRPQPSPSSVARHSCDNPPCVNPKHLLWGSQRDNVYDTIERGRKKIARGEDVSTKFTNDDILFIRQSYADESMTMKDLAARYSARKTMISQIVRGDAWAHVGGPRTLNRPPKQHPEAATILRMFYMGMLQCDIAAHVGASEATVSRIVNGRKVRRPRMDAAAVEQIRHEYAAGESANSIGARRGLTTSAVTDIAAGRSWVNAGGPISAIRGPNAKAASRHTPR